MYSLYGSMACATCHKAGGSAAPAPSINMEGIAMKPGVACASCHGAGKSESDEPLFINLMNDTAKIVYNRCDSCHVVTGSSDD
jgi:nitrate/TMAO reductase-like tetraheme cytochrome c subunit